MTTPILEDVLGEEVWRAHRRQRAFSALEGLSKHDRGLVMCWFCDDCAAYIPPGKSCKCNPNAAR